MSPVCAAARHSPGRRATQYLYESVAVSLSTFPVAPLLASINGCIPQYAHVGCFFRLIVPRAPDDPPRLSAPLPSHVPELAPHVHSGVEPPGNPVPAEIGHPSVAIDSPPV